MLLIITAYVAYFESLTYRDHITNATVRRRSGFPLKLLQLVQTRQLRFFGHAVRTDPSLDINRALRVSVRGLPRDWKRRPGRPRHTWLRSVEADLLSLNLGLNAAWRLAQNRTRWRHFMETARSSQGHAPDDDDDDDDDSFDEI